MNKIYLLILVLAMSFQFALAQTVPQGMNYQAVARDKDGDVLSEEKISIKIVLFTNSKIVDEHYTEIHNIQTNKLGLFSLVVGEGDVYAGEFDKIPWSSQEIWMDVFVQYGGIPNFTKITSSKLYAVPYAFVAGQLADENTASDRFKITNCPCHVGLVTLEILYTGPAATVSAYADANLNKLLFTYATVNYRDIISLDGSINMPSGTLSDVTYMEVTTGSGTTVTMMNTKCTDYDQDLNNPVAGETFGDFSILSHTDKNGTLCTACDMKPDWKVGGNGLFDDIDCNTIGTLSNTDFVFITNDEERMRILKDGDVDITNSLAVGVDLYVGNNAEICNDLTVKQSVNLNTLGGATTNYGPFTVGQVSPTLLTGTLNVNEATDLDKTLNVDGETDLNATLRVNNQAPSELSGSLTVDGVTLLKNTLTVEGATTLESTLEVDSATTLHYTLEVDELTHIYDSLIVDEVACLGGLKVEGKALFKDQFRISVSDSALATFDTSCAATTDNGLNFGAYGLLVEGINQGIAIKVKGSKANKNNFVAFWDETTAPATSISGVTTCPGPTMWGRIEGEIPSEYTNNADYNFDQQGMKWNIASSVISVAFAAIDLATQGGETTASITSITPCVGLGVCVTAPIVSYIVEDAVSLVVSIAQLVTTSIFAVKAGVDLAIYDSNKNKFQGVTYASGAGDYAEFLLRENINESMRFGDIVGVKGGKVSKNTTGAEKMMVVSFKPIVLGNMPQPDAEHEYEKVAFMGQVPVKVFGKVNIGDYILPDGYNNGMGIAISPSEIKTSDLKKIVGIAWNSSEDPYGVNLINTAVGINTNDVMPIVEGLEQRLNSQATELDALKKQMNEVNTLLAQLIPGFVAPESVDNTSTSSSVNSSSKQSSISNTTASGNKEVDPDVPVFTKDDMILAFTVAEHRMSHDTKTNIEEHPFWNKFHSDSNFKDKIIDVTYNAIHSGNYDEIQLLLKSESMIIE